MSRKSHFRKPRPAPAPSEASPPVEVPPALLAAAAWIQNAAAKLGAVGPALADLVQCTAGFAGAVRIVLEPLNEPGDIAVRVAATNARAEILARVLNGAGEVFAKRLNEAATAAAPADSAGTLLN